MIEKIKLYFHITLYISVFVLLFVLVIFIKNNKNIKQENKRLSNNQTILLNNTKSYRDKYNASIVEVDALVNSKDEFKRLYEEEYKKVGELNINIKRLKSYTEMTTKTTIPIKTYIRDSIYFYEHSWDTIKCLNIRNNYISFNACIDYEDTLIGEINVVDTLIQTVSIIPKKFLFFKYGCKGIKQTIKSTNPYSTIISNRYIEIK